MKKKNGILLVLVVISVLLLTACGRTPAASSGYQPKAPTEEEVVVKLEEEDTSVVPVTDEEEESTRYMKMGTISTIADLGQKIWIQYEYDSDGDLYATREYDADAAAGCYEYIYDKNGNMLAQNWVEADGSKTSLVSYEYDDNGNLIKEISFGIVEDEIVTSYENEADASGKLISCNIYNNSGEYLAKRTYEYHDNGIVKKETRYLPDGTLEEEVFYDEQGNMLEDKYYQNGQIYIHTMFEYEYDEQGNRTKYVSKGDAPQRIITYKNYYDGYDNLIKIETYEDNGMLSQVQEYAYMEFDENKLVCSLEETYSIIEGAKTENEGGEEERQESDNTVDTGDFDFASLEKMIFGDFTMFTHGEYGPHHMVLESVEFDELGVENGRQYCEVILRYSSDYGTFRYRGRAFYEKNLNGVNEIVECRYAGYFNDNPTVDWETIDAQRAVETTYVYSGHYHKVFSDEYGNESYDPQYDYSFACKNDVEGLYREITPYSDKDGTYMFSPSDEDGYEFVLQICLKNGLCEKYYGNTIVPTFTYAPGHVPPKLALYEDDYYRGINSEPLILSYPY